MAEPVQEEGVRVRIRIEAALGGRGAPQGVHSERDRRVLAVRERGAGARVPAADGGRLRQTGPRLPQQGVRPLQRRPRGGGVRLSLRRKWQAQFRQRLTLNRTAQIKVLSTGGEKPEARFFALGWESWEPDWKPIGIVLPKYG